MTGSQLSSTSSGITPSQRLKSPLNIKQPHLSNHSLGQKVNLGTQQVQVDDGTQTWENSCFSTCFSGNRGVPAPAVPREGGMLLARRRAAERTTSARLSPCRPAGLACCSLQRRGSHLFQAHRALFGRRAAGKQPDPRRHGGDPRVQQVSDQEGEGNPGLEARPSDRLVKLIFRLNGAFLQINLFFLSAGSEAESKEVGAGGVPRDREASTGPGELCGCLPPLQPLGAGKDRVWGQGARQDGGGLREYWQEGKSLGVAFRGRVKVSSLQLLPVGRKLNFPWNRSTHGQFKGWG